MHQGVCGPVAEFCIWPQPWMSGQRWDWLELICCCRCICRCIVLGLVGCCWHCATGPHESATLSRVACCKKSVYQGGMKICSMGYSYRHWAGGIVEWLTGIYSAVHCTTVQDSRASVQRGLRCWFAARFAADASMCAPDSGACMCRG